MIDCWEESDSGLLFCSLLYEKS